MKSIVSFGQCDTIFLLGLAIIRNLIVDVSTVSIRFDTTPLFKLFLVYWTAYVVLFVDFF